MGHVDVQIELSGGPDCRTAEQFQVGSRTTRHDNHKMLTFQIAIRPSLWEMPRFVRRLELQLHIRDQMCLLVQRQRHKGITKRQTSNIQV